MISDEKQYEFVTSQIKLQTERIYDAFKLFVQVFSAIVGGSVWLSMQKPPTTSQNYAFLADSIAILAAFITVVMILLNVISWFGYRKELTRLAPNVPPPKLFPATVIEAAMICSMIAAAALFVWFNPFRSN
jgi:hypothetical protein